VFGQSRQEDLVSYLLTHLPPDEISKVVDQLRIDLATAQSEGDAPAPLTCLPSRAESLPAAG
jgi:hypothetical protein